MNDHLIEIKGMTKVYGMDEAAVSALAGVDVEVSRGEFVAIMGPSGSGKSTLMNILGCLDRPTDGTYILDGRSVSQMDKDELADIRNEKLGFIFQSFNLLPRLSALSNVMLPLLYNQEEISDEDAESRAVASLESVGLGSRLHHRPNQLSGGQQQRVAIARALVNRPPLILADEPTGRISVQGRRAQMNENRFELALAKLLMQVLQRVAFNHLMMAVEVLPHLLDKLVVPTKQQNTLAVAVNVLLHGSSPVRFALRNAARMATSRRVGNNCKPSR